VSTPAVPKQLLPLVSGQPMLRDTLDRLAPVAAAGHTLVLTNASLVPTIRAMAPELPADNVIAEPRPAGTAAALAWAAHEIARRDGRDATMLSMHADSAIGDVALFRERLGQAIDAAQREHTLVTVGIVPTHPDTGLGYIEPGAEAARGTARRVVRFIEKPNAAQAKELVAAGCLWNSGIFAWRAGDFLDELFAHCPEVAPALAAHGDDAKAFFGAVQSIAVDVGVLERSARVMVVPGDFGWSDVGTWSALRTVRAGDEQGNVTSGATYLRDATGNVVYADGPRVVLYGVKDLVVVSTNGLTLVTTVEKAMDLKALLAELPDEVRSR
jgi:mannose-1-phosphate guanylyltransferase